MPNTKFKKVWNIIIIILLLYTATFVPYKTSFYDEDPIGIYYWEWIVDSLFMLDILINLFSAYEDPDSGLIEVRLKKIAKSYIYSWLFLDIAACIPFQLIESG